MSTSTDPRHSNIRTSPNHACPRGQYTLSACQSCLLLTSVTLPRPCSPAASDLLTVSATMHMSAPRLLFTSRDRLTFCPTPTQL